MTDHLFFVEEVAARELYELRRRVLRGGDPAKSVSDPRDDEDASLHLGGLLEERLVVCASFYLSESPTDTELRSFQLRYMATDPDVQGQGLGAAVLSSGVTKLRHRGAQQLWANARDTALGFYRATGWTPVAKSEHLSRETQLPHTVIVRLL